MVDLICVPRINALGLKGPENSCKEILRSRKYITLDTPNEAINLDQENIYKAAKNALKKKCFFVGGDHSITFPIGKAFLKKYGKNDSLLIVFDAHADCMPAMIEPTHEEIINGLVQEGWDPQNIILIGLRKIEPTELDFLKNNNIPYFMVEESLEKILNVVRQKGLNKKIYISIDIDVFDPRIAPGVNYPENGGLNKKDFFNLFKKINIEFNVQAYDLVEIVKSKDIDKKTIKLGQEILNFVINL